MLNSKALAASASAAKVYVEDVMSVYLYTGNGSTQTITNGIDLSGKGGLVWAKSRSAAYFHSLTDTARGAHQVLQSQATDASFNQTPNGVSFSSSGFILNSSDNGTNENATTYTSWTFRKAAKFFDVCTWTGSGANRTISHNLGSVPGCIIVKCTSAADNWQVYHRSLGATKFLNLDATSAAGTNSNRWNNTEPTSSVFTVGTGAGVNGNGLTYVAYLFAHDAGGFGGSGAEGVISCGSYTGNGSATGPAVTLNWEPQWLLIKRSDSTGGDWQLIDNMRGFVVGGADAELNPNLSAAESSGTFVTPTSTGFQLNTTDAGYNASGGTYIYIAIRRGPMKTPTDATKVFKIDKSADSTRNFGIVVDTVLSHIPAGNSGNFPSISARLTGNGAKLTTFDTASESTNSNWYAWDKATGLWGETWGTSWINYAFRRAPGFFDVVAYTGTNTAGQNAVPHNLGAVPELIIYKARTGATNVAWYVYSAGIGINYYLLLNGSNAKTNFSLSNGVSPTSSNFYTTPGDSATSATGYTYIAYLFASCPGVSKVGSYTGTGTTLNINCGFTAGARFVLIKRTDSTGDWYVWDTARGISTLIEPYLLLNSTAAEETGEYGISPFASGFSVNSLFPPVNTNGANYIFLAIA
jgi:hypothetical protein